MPATFQFSKEPGRVERLLVGLFEEEGELEARRVPADESPEFFSPAMFEARTEPGRIERFLDAMFDRTEEQGRNVVPQEFRDDFYLPGADPDEHKRKE